MTSSRSGRSGRAPRRSPGGFDPIPFRQRLYSVEELTDIYRSVGMRLANVFRGSGKARLPRDNQFEIFVEGRKE